MSSMIARRALLGIAPISRRTFATTTRRLATESEHKADLKRETRRNPELFILAGVVALALAGSGFYLGRSPTGSTSEANVAVADGGMPWQTDADAGGKYKYHPGADPQQTPKDAPSAINETIIPDVVLSKHLHETWNKFGRDP